MCSAPNKPSTCLDISSYLTCSNLHDGSLSRNRSMTIFEGFVSDKMIVNGISFCSGPQLIATTPARGVCPHIVAFDPIHKIYYGWCIRKTNGYLAILIKPSTVRSLRIVPVEDATFSILAQGHASALNRLISQVRLFSKGINIEQ